MEGLTVAILDTRRPPRFPSECPQCGHDADASVRMTKVFARRTRRGVVWIHYHVDVRACRTCVSAHETVVRLDADRLSQTRRRQAAAVGPIVGAGGAVVASGLLLASAGADAASRQATTLSAATMAAIGLGLAGIGVGMM